MRSLTLVVPWAAGGGTDVMGRIMARRMSEILGQQVIVENVAGSPWHHEGERARRPILPRC